MSSKQSIKSKQSQKSRKVKSKSRKSKASQKSRQSKKQSKKLAQEIELSKEMSKRMSKKTPMVASSHGIKLLKRSKLNMSKGRPLASARDFLLATSILTAALSPYDPHPMAKKSQIAPDTQVHLDWHKGQFPDKQLTSKQYKKLMKRERLATIQEGGMKKGDLITVHWPLDDGINTRPFTMAYYSKDWATDLKRYGGDGKVYKIKGMKFEVVELEKKQTPGPRVGDKYQAEIPPLRTLKSAQSRLGEPPLLEEEYTMPFYGETTSKQLEGSFTYATSGTGHLTSKAAARKTISSINRHGGGKWSLKYKRKINCKRPKGFSQKQYCKRISRKKKKRRTKKNRKKRTKKRRRK